MDIDYQNEPDIALITLSGRFDTHGAEQLSDLLEAEAPKSKAICVDMGEVDYLSSGGIRVLVWILKRLSEPDLLALANPTDFVREIFRVTGMEKLFRIYPNPTEAVEALRAQFAGGYRRDRGEEQTEIGTFRYRAGSDAPTALEVVGDIVDVLHARITPESLALKKFSEKEYSIGLGAIGESADDCAAFVGEMMTIGGTMVWLPTDGNDTPDFLVPRGNSDVVGIRTAFNVSLVGGFNEYCLFLSASPEGAPLAEIYARLFARAREQRGDKAGVIALAMRANLKEVYGSGIKIAPLADFAPPGSEMIIAPEHIERWFESDEHSRHNDVAALLVGFGLNLGADLSDYDQEDLDAVFFVHPANVGHEKHIMHNHAVIFDSAPLPSDDEVLEDVVDRTIEDGSFRDMRHVLYTTLIDHALIGVSYISEIRRDTES